MKRNDRVRSTLARAVAANFAVAATVSCLTILLPTARGQELSEAEKKLVLEEIAKIEEKLNDSKSANNLRALKRFREASASPQASLAYYQECVKARDFDSKERKESEWREWRDAQADFKDSGFAKALQFQLRYLVLTVQAGMRDADDESGNASIVSATADFLAALISNYRDVANHNDVLTTRVMGSVFADASRLSDTLTKPQHWNDAPLDIDGVYDQIILPYYRSTKNGSSLQNAWEARINQLTTVLGTPEPVKISTRSRTGAQGARGARAPGGAATQDRDRARELRRDNARDAEERLAEFREERLPELEWEMNRDAFLFGTNKSAVVRRLGSHIRSNLGHGAASTWIEELRTLAKGEYKIEDYIDLEAKADDEAED